MHGQVQAQTRFNLYHFSIVFSPIQKGVNIVLPALTSSTISTVPKDGLFRLSKSAWNINLIDSRLMWATSFPTSIPGVFLSDDRRGEGDGHLHLGLSGGGKDNGSLLDRAFNLIFLWSYHLTNTWVSRKQSYYHLIELANPDPALFLEGQCLGEFRSNLPKHACLEVSSYHEYID